MSTGDAVVRKLVTFGRILREAGVEVGPGRIQDALRALGRRREADDDVVEGPLGVEHHRRERARARDALLREHARRYLLLVGRHLAQAEAVREAPRGVDREAEHPLASARGVQREGGGAGRLADAARAHAHHDTMAREHVREGHGRGDASTRSAPRRTA